MFSLSQRIAKVLTMIKQNAMVVYLPDVKDKLCHQEGRRKHVWRMQNKNIYQPKQPKGNVPPESHAWADPQN